MRITGWYKWFRIAPNDKGLKLYITNVEALYSAARVLVSYRTCPI
jgi:hypothetical protein